LKIDLTRRGVRAATRDRRLLYDDPKTLTVDGDRARVPVGNYDVFSKVLMEHCDLSAWAAELIDNNLRRVFVNAIDRLVSGACKHEAQVADEELRSLD
jgi:hypothetical protein